MTSLPLDGIKIVSLAEQYPGPFATMLLSDLGADVILIERPDRGDPTRAFEAFHAAMARGKRSVVLDLKTDRGRRAARAVIGDADALLEGFRPGTMDRLGLGYDLLRATNPGLVYVSISGYGQSGPDRTRPGHDITYQAEAGMLHEHLPPNPPPPPPSLALGDLAAGMMAAQAVLAGIVSRQRTGIGTYVDVSMLDCLVSLLSAHIGPVVNGTGRPGFPYEPGYGVFVTSDEQYLALGVAHENRFWQALCEVTGLVADAGLSAEERRAGDGRLHGELSDALKTKTADEWAGLFAEADIPFGRVRTLGELVESPQVQARGMLSAVPGNDVIFVRQPLCFDGHAPAPRRGVPALGEHTAEVLTAAGLSPADVAALDPMDPPGIAV